VKNKLKLTTTSKASTAMLYDLIKTNAVLSQIIKDQQKEIKILHDINKWNCKEEDES
tara:strand:+ start:138 stop:308 length:171 start_codon:yes stop_codon:yes gene_type:complete